MTLEVSDRCSGGGAGARRVPGGADRRPFGFSGTRPAYAPDRLADIRHTRLELRVDPRRRTLEGLATHRLAPVGEPLRRLTLDLCELSVDEVTLGGKTLEFHHEDGRLEIRFKPPLALGKEAEVGIRYHGSPRTGLNFTGPDKDYPDRPYQAWSQGQDQYARFWFPTHDYPNQKQTTEVIVEAPAEFETISNGRLLEVATKGRWKRWHWLQDIPHVSYLVSLVVGVFESWQDSVDGVPLQYHVPPGRVPDGHRAFDETPAMVRILGELAGMPYPYARYASVVVRDFTWGGMENTSATTFTEHILPDERAATDYDPTQIVSHELAHQWFGDLVTCREWAHAWLNEGFASYAEVHYAEQAHGEDEAHRMRIQDAEKYFAEDREYRRPVVARTFSDPTEMFDVHLYEKGAWVLWMLRGVLGDSMFIATVHEYVRRHARGLVVTEDLQRAAEDVSGKSLGWFFDQWVYGGGHPEFEVGYAWDEASSTAELKVHQAQKVDAVTHVFRAPLRVAFGLPGGRRSAHDVEVGLTGPDDGFTFTLPTRPAWVRFDAGNRVLKTLDFKRPEELLRGQLKEDEVSGRVEAAAQLGRMGTPTAVDALVEALKGDGFWFVRAAAAQALGEAQGEVARATLLAGLKQPNSRVRSAVAAALGAFHGDDDVAAALTRTLRRDRSYATAAAAATALGAIGAKKATEALREAADLPSHRSVLAIGALRGLAALRDPEQLGFILDHARPGHEERQRADAVVSAATLARSTSREQREEVRRFAERALRDPLYFARRGAIRALRTLGDPVAIPALEATIERDIEGAVRYEAREVVDAIRRGLPDKQELAGLRDEVDALRRSQRELRDRLDRLEPRGKGRRK